ncbi:AAA domain-containing protein [Lutibacter oricola]|uniref:AAA domain-containing protein n=1 Tax=Lutibacter oricola TaxID=762486 RepID=A0A1H2WUI2_9FLAO|nr:DEAD/DEAH box helicase [Lutibacter oricola]SDW84158.1 AAA domain-containing protein [Lutibacter oricola]
MNNLNNWLNYYKNSLTDSENLAVDISSIKNLFHQNYCDLDAATINSKNATDMLDAEERRINRIKGITKQDSAKWHKVVETEIIIAPFQLDYHTNNENFKQKSIHPFWISAKVNRLGQLSAPKEVFPLIVRNYLDPIADVGNDFIFSNMDTISLLRDVEKPTAEENEEIEWGVYWSYVNKIFSEITFGAINDYNVKGYKTNHKTTYFARSSKISAAKSILFLYENLVNYKEELPLISKLINTTDRNRREAITDQGFLDFNHLHLGQMSNEFPLSISQRKSLLSYLTAEENAITAVNGPPGTGKTTLLQSLVATEVVKAAIKGEEAPVILACSTNNQAVTNIIDSFINSKSSMDNLAERWIPRFNGYATYLPSSSKSEKGLKNINYLKGNMFGNEGTLCDLENEDYLIDAEHYYYNKYSTYFQYEPDSLEDVCDKLQEDISIIEDKLIDGVRISKNYLNSIEKVNKLLLHKENRIQKNEIKISKLQQWRTIITGILKLAKEDNFISEIQRYFKTDSDKSAPTEEQLFKVGNNILNDTETALSFIKHCIADLNLALTSNLKLSNWKHQNSVSGYPFISEEQMWKNEYDKMASDDKSHRFFYDEIDLSLRHEAFLLATHYWEARWILETRDVLENETEKGTGENTIIAKWKRRAMLTPCFVATLYTAPTHFLYSQFQGENENGKPIFEYLPLYNFLDLLIIDEAGQVTPEVSIPVFSLAQKAIVVGDLKQIEPIWTIPQKIDQGNLTNENIITNLAQNDYLNEIGFLASSGSIMRMAQNACEYETPLVTKKENGLLLLEHRRCNDEIIGFCNELAYDGILKPMKGKAREDQIFPSMMAYHIEGFSERKFNSRHNINEVKSIILWLNRNKEDIEKAYGVDSIESILGIITPFASQKTELSKALIKSGFKVNDIKLGTVHALQGAERNIVLFSSVYSNSDEGTLFFDRDNKPNMLNVAVSRARDSFILFGDTRIFDETKNTPSGILKKHLNMYEMPS